MSQPPAIERRKRDHLTLCASGDVDFRQQRTLLDEVVLVHCALPDIALEQIDLETTLLGKRLRAPLVIAGMTGGTPEAALINRDLAGIAERLGIGFGLGSQRAMLEHEDLAFTYQVREVAPTTLVLGNLGLVQARRLPTTVVHALVEKIGADALCLHMNPAMELVQPGGDRDFAAGSETLARLAAELGVPVVAKETGSGISRAVGRRLCQAGIRAVDVSGAGGTSWVGVEALRAEGNARLLGEELWDWGIPTAASVGMLQGLGLEVIATGGIRHGLDVAHALALGAKAAGMAAPVLRAYRTAGVAGALVWLENVIASLRAVVLLTGCRRAADLAQAPRVIGPALRAWLDAAGESNR